MPAEVEKDCRFFFIVDGFSDRKFSATDLSVTL